MPKFYVSVEHSLPREQAIDQLKGFSDSFRDKSPVELTDLKESWDPDGNLDFAFKAMGMAISGTMKTSDSQIIVSGKMPLAAAMFRGAIETQIADQIRAAIG